MNALLHAFTALDTNGRPLCKYDGVEDIESPLQKWAVRCYYLITQHGVPNSRPDMGPDADGQPTEVRIVKCSLVQRETGHEMPAELSDFTADEIAEFSENIEQMLDEEEV